MQATYPAVAEYGDVRKQNLPVSTYTTLAVAGKDGREYRLSYITRGYECAGSAMRWQEHDVWAVTFYLDGARHGRRHDNLENARADLDKRVS